MDYAPIDPTVDVPEIAAHVAMAAVALDSHADVPTDWRGLIDFEALDLGGTTLCILGQLFGHECDAPQDLYDDPDLFYAFGVSVPSAHLPHIEEAWRVYVAMTV